MNDEEFIDLKSKVQIALGNLADRLDMLRRAGDETCPEKPLGYVEALIAREIDNKWHCQRVFHKQGGPGQTASDEAEFTQKKQRNLLRSLNIDVPCSDHLFNCELSIPNWDFDDLIETGLYKFDQIPFGHLHERRSLALYVKDKSKDEPLTRRLGAALDVIGFMLMLGKPELIENDPNISDLIKYLLLTDGHKTPCSSELEKHTFLRWQTPLFRWLHSEPQRIGYINVVADAQFDLDAEGKMAQHISDHITDVAAAFLLSTTPEHHEVDRRSGENAIGEALMRYMGRKIDKELVQTLAKSLDNKGFDKGGGKNVVAEFVKAAYEQNCKTNNIQPDEAWITTPKAVSTISFISTNLCVGQVKSQAGKAAEYLRLGGALAKSKK